MRARTKRLWGVGTAAALLVSAVALSAMALKQHADLFYTPGLIAQNGMPDEGKRVRVGGWVQEGSLAYGDGAEMNFLIEDGSGETVMVSYTGIAPDLFREGEGVVATGRFGPHGDFTAEQILAKHDENYEPRELKKVQQAAS
ncbi:cytochrome c maturation protein CcmE [Henriciella aquimarina]|uniref:cytochrome c maturation protein CcmE n=1 Tax=Henriciella aquimarina TaxID=545261 RepID=UPI0009FE7CCD|nr:cytochrome c maturation protein CcmE [Henriciella aquimarina]